MKNKPTTIITIITIIIIFTDVNLYTNNHHFSFQQTLFKLSFPLMVSIWFPFLLFLSTFGFNHGDNEGNVDAHNRNFTNTTTTTTYEQGESHTDRVLLEFNVSGVVSNDHSFVADTEKNPNHPNPETSPVEEVVSKVLGYSALVCEREFQDSYVENKQEDVQNGRTHLTYLNLDEFRNITKKDNGSSGGAASSGLANITHRLEPMGPTITMRRAHNKEANGASNILGDDHDKYLRNPCSVSEKYVVIELAEETLVDAVKIANFEHHSSNFKQFSLSGSLVFPTETWYPLGTFVAENVKHHQYFKLPEPKWTRYLKLTLVSHYGSEFYCTLNVIKVYGVDAIERMLEDLIVTSEESANLNSTHLRLRRRLRDGEFRNVAEATSRKTERVDDGGKRVDDDVTKKPVKIPELVSKGNGRIHGDAVLKILMQKVRLHEKNLSLLEDYIKELNKRQGDVLPQLDVELAKYSALVEKTRSEIKELLLWKANMVRFVSLNGKGNCGFGVVEAFVSSHLESIVKENAMLRQSIEKVAVDQESLDKAELAVLTSNLSYVHPLFFGKAHRDDRSWKLLLVTSVITAIIAFNFY
ncbi:hypothetical protein OSB04_022192 [Centaurea solstitialis]|uniref:SUN domain-containing protein n=1 Tax=Centaurea solstitialis TaxID=347529 RepID=A0AA38WH01_9ASTR|nr:hypothetical protein OSB04_022192 [Centaurea solstitialis]